MTQAEWDVCEDPNALWRCVELSASARKVRLYMCGCLRRVWPALEDPRSRRAVEAAEEFVEGELSPADLQDACRAAEEAMRESWSRYAPWSRRMAAGVAYWATLPQHESPGLLWTSYRGVQPQRSGGQRRVNGGLAHHRKKWAALLRDVFGNPFRPPARIDPAWLAWNGGAIGRMALAIYDDRAFGRLPLLADALEEAGCTDAAVLAHCRGPCEHIRGCWVVDLLLGRA